MRKLSLGVDFAQKHKFIEGDSDKNQNKAARQRASKNICLLLEMTQRNNMRLT